MASIIKVDTIQTAAGGTPTAADLGIDTSGSVVNFLTIEETAYTSISTQTFTATPFTLSITPKSATNKLYLVLSVNGINNSTSTTAARFELYQDGSSIAYLNDIAGFFNATGNSQDSSFSASYTMTAGTTEETTFTVYWRCHSSGVTCRYNNYSSGNNRTRSSLTLMEIAG